MLVQVVAYKVPSVRQYIDLIHTLMSRAHIACQWPPLSYEALMGIGMDQLQDINEVRTTCAC